MDSPRWRTASGDAPVTGSPRSSTRPSSGASEPAAIAISVDLPAPFSPSRAWISPARASNVTPLRASTPSKLFRTPASRSTSVMAVLAEGFQGGDDALERRLLLGRGQAAGHDGGGRERGVADRLVRAAADRVLVVLLRDHGRRGHRALGGQGDGVPHGVLHHPG